MKFMQLSNSQKTSLRLPLSAHNTGDQDGAQRQFVGSRGFLKAGSSPRLLETKAASEEVPKIQDFQRLVHEAGIKNKWSTKEIYVEP